MMSTMAHSILAEQLVDSYEKAAVISGRSPQSESRKMPAQCLPEEIFICGTDDPEHPDRDAGLQSMLLNVTGEGIADELQATLRCEEDWEGLCLLVDLGTPARTTGGCRTALFPAKRRCRVRSSERQYC